MMYSIGGIYGYLESKPAPIQSMALKKVVCCNRTWDPVTKVRVSTRRVQILVCSDVLWKCLLGILVRVRKAATVSSSSSNNAVSRVQSRQVRIFVASLNSRWTRSAASPIVPSLELLMGGLAFFRSNQTSSSTLLLCPLT